MYNHPDGEFAVEFMLIRKESKAETTTLYPSFGKTFATRALAEQAGFDKACEIIDRKS